MIPLSKAIVVAFGGSVVLIVSTVAWYRYHSKRNRIPKEWVEIGEVGDLWIYPLKSGKAMEVEEADCEEAGITLREESKFTLKDRSLLIYSGENGEYRNAKTFPNIVLISVTSEGQEHIKFEAPGTEPLIVEVPSKKGPSIPCTLWKGELQRCIDCGDEASRWISQYCLKRDTGLRIGMSSQRKRNMSEEPWARYKAIYNEFRNEDMGIFSDLSSYLIVNQASLEDLNERLPNTTSPLNFRPNIVVEGPVAYSEDSWEWIKIGNETVFRNVRPCTRCSVVNIDPETGIALPDGDVLRKLKDYRQLTDPKKRAVEGTSPVFGIYAGIRKPGRIRLGDKVYIGKA